MSVNLYVGNLSYDTTEEELRALFAQAGKVQSVHVVRDRNTDSSKGFAFVEMASQADAQKAISLFHASKLNGRPLTVKLARPHGEHSVAVRAPSPVRENSPQGGSEPASHGRHIPPGQFKQALSRDEEMDHEAASAPGGENILHALAPEKVRPASRRRLAPGRRDGSRSGICSRR